MKPRLRTIGLFLLLGVVTTIVLAWMFALVGTVGVFQDRYVTNTFGPGTPAASADLTWPAGTPSEWPDPTWVSSGTGRGTWAETATGSRPEDQATARQYKITVVRFGWPRPAMRWRLGCVSDVSNPEIERVGGVWIMLPDWVEELPFLDHSRRHPWRRRLPLEIAWPGFMLDMLLYGGGLWLLLRARHAIRRAARRRRKQCLACGYPIGASQVCTECGQSVSPCVARASG